MNLFTYQNNATLSRQLGILRDINTTKPQAKKAADIVYDTFLFEALSVCAQIRESTTAMQYKYNQLNYDESKIAVIPVIRAGLAGNRFWDTLDCPVLLYTASRNEVPGKPPVTTGKFYDSLGKVKAHLEGVEDIFVVDPMIATAGTNIYVVEDTLKVADPKSINFVGVLAAQYGIDKIREHSKKNWDFETNVFVIDVDSLEVPEGLGPGLDKNAFIVPGLGDAGDRFFGTTKEPVAVESTV